MYRFRQLLLLIFLVLIPVLSFSQNGIDSTKFFQSNEAKFVIAPAGVVEFTTPQKYGGSFNLTFGKKIKETTIYQEGDAPSESHSLKGVNLEAGLYRGGYRFSVYYINVGYSLIGVAGGRVGLVHLKNNSFSRVFKSTDLIGVEAELYAFYKLKVGILKAVDENRYIPSLGFGFGIGPNFF